MNKRIEKRHKRQVARAKAKRKESEPDLRTPEQVLAARAASRPTSGWPNAGGSNNSTAAARNEAGPVARTSPKVGD